MYPYSIIVGIDLYTVFLCIGLIGAIVVFRLFSDRIKMNWRVQNFCILVAFVSIVIGYLSAVFFQALYDIESRGGFIIDSSTGATFYGGLIGGAGCFIALYFGIGSFWFKDKVHIDSFFSLADIAAASIAIAHGFGRIGCLMAGCCHGKIVDAWYSVYMPAINAKAVPLQLYEALFLFAMFALCTFLLLKFKFRHNMSVYLVSYGIFRFLIEYVRDDARGTLAEGISPSQFWAIFMVVIGVALYFWLEFFWSKYPSALAPADVPEKAKKNDAE